MFKEITFVLLDITIVICVDFNSFKNSDWITSIILFIKFFIICKGTDYIYIFVNILHGINTFFLLLGLIRVSWKKIISR